MSLTDVKTTLVGRIRTLVTRTVEEHIYNSLILQGKMASWQVRSMKSIQRLQDAEFKVLSQWGEDGIIDWLVERLALPPRLHSFVEFGVGNYTEANTRFLMENRNWRGLIMDGDPQLADIPQTDNRHHLHDLTTRSAFITRENINDLLSGAGFTGEIGLLSVDVDGNDYWIWEAISVAQPVIVISEFNAIFGDMHPVSIPYDPAFVCGSTHPSRIYFGTSLAALISLGSRKGYRFVGTTLVGNDAFFVREDYASRLDGALMSVVACPTRCPIPISKPGELKWLKGFDRLKEVLDLPLINTETGQAATLSQLGPAYSEDWAQQTTGTPPQ